MTESTRQQLCWGSSTTKTFSCQQLISSAADISCFSTVSTGVLDLFKF